MVQVDLNCDLGESFGAYSIGADELVLPLVSSVNIACGWHAGDPAVMAKTVAMAKASGIAAGAHPGYPDLVGFGRRNMDITPHEAKNYVIYQIGALAAFAKSAGTTLQHVKLHGAFYNRAAADQKLARGVCEAVAAVDPGLIVLTLAGSAMLQVAEQCGLPTASEVFADRAYNEDGSLVPRNQPGAVIHDEELAIRRVVTMVRQGKVEAITGRDIAIRADSICVHGDNPGALNFVRGIRRALEGEGIAVANLAAVLGGPR